MVVLVAMSIGAGVLLALVAVVAMGGWRLWPGPAEWWTALILGGGCGVLVAPVVVRSFRMPRTWRWIPMVYVVSGVVAAATGGVLGPLSACSTGAVLVLTSAVVGAYGWASPLDVPGRCEACGYDLRGLPRDASRCPECGRERAEVRKSPR